MAGGGCKRQPGQHQRKIRAKIHKYQAAGSAAELGESERSGANPCHGSQQVKSLDADMSWKARCVRNNNRFIGCGFPQDEPATNRDLFRLLLVSEHRLLRLVRGRYACSGGKPRAKAAEYRG